MQSKKTPKFKIIKKKILNSSQNKREFDALFDASHMSTGQQDGLQLNQTMQANHSMQAMDNQKSLGNSQIMDGNPSRATAANADERGGNMDERGRNMDERGRNMDERGLNIKDLFIYDLTGYQESDQSRLSFAQHSLIKSPSQSITNSEIKSQMSSKQDQYEIDSKLNKILKKYKQNLHHATNEQRYASPGRKSTPLAAIENTSRYQKPFSSSLSGVYNIVSDSPNKVDIENVDIENVDVLLESIRNRYLCLESIDSF